MSKVAAFAPMLISAALSAAGAAINYAGQKSAQSKNEKSKREWLAYQNRQKRIAQQREDEERNRARGELAKVEEANTRDAREEVIEDETARLTEDWEGSVRPASFTTDEARGTGQEAGRSEVFDASLARELGDATEESRNRIRNLARATSYGSGTLGGMGMTLGDVFDNAATEVGFINDRRRGNTNTLQRYQTVEPEMFEYTGSPLASALSMGGSLVGSMGGGGGLGSIFGGGSAAPMTSPIPVPRPAGLGGTPHWTGLKF